MNIYTQIWLAGVIFFLVRSILSSIKNKDKINRDIDDSMFSRGFIKVFIWVFIFILSLGSWVSVVLAIITKKMHKKHENG